MKSKATGKYLALQEGNNNDRCNNNYKINRKERQVASLTYDIGNNDSWNVATQHSEEGAEAANQQAELQQKKHNQNILTPSPGFSDFFLFFDFNSSSCCQVVSLTLPGFCCLNADISWMKSLRESPSWGPVLDRLSCPESMISQLESHKPRNQNQSLKLKNVSLLHMRIQNGWTVKKGFSQPGTDVNKTGVCLLLDRFLPNYIKQFNFVYIRVVTQKNKVKVFGSFNN